MRPPATQTRGLYGHCASDIDSKHRGELEAGTRHQSDVDSKKPGFGFTSLFTRPSPFPPFPRPPSHSLNPKAEIENEREEDRYWAGSVCGMKRGGGGLVGLPRVPGGVTYAAPDAAERGVEASEFTQLPL